MCGWVDARVRVVSCVFLYLYLYHLGGFLPIAFRMASWVITSRSWFMILIHIQIISIKKTHFERYFVIFFL